MQHFIPTIPPDARLTTISRTVGTDQFVDEMIFSFTHTQEMPWMLPGVPPTHKKVEIPLVAIVEFRDGKLAHEHIYEDQASLLTAVVQTLLISSTSITPHAPTFASYSDCCLLAICRATGLAIAIESFALLCQELPDLLQRNP